MLAGMAVQSALQMGLHRPNSPEDFTKFRLELAAAAVADRGRTWIASNVVIQRQARVISSRVGANLGIASALVSGYLRQRKYEIGLL